MNSLSILIHPKSPLGRAILAAQDPAEIIVPIACNPAEAEWLETHYPWFNIVRLYEQSISIPSTTGPVRIFNCRTMPQAKDSPEAQDYKHTMLSDLSTLRRVLSLCGTLPAHILFVSTASAESPAPISLSALTVQSELERISVQRPDTKLSIFCPGKLNNYSTGTPFHTFTTYSKLANIMIRTAVHSISGRIIVGTDAYLEIFKLKIAGYFKVFRHADINHVDTGKSLVWKAARSSAMFEKHAVEALQ
jgi:hypothetical protein